jgi:hypothetical protein
MIPLNAIPWRLVGYAVAGAAVLALGWRVHAWREAYTVDLPAAQEALQREIACGEGSECLKRSISAQAQAEAASAVIVKGYEDELESLRNRPVRTRTVRLCPEATDGDVRVPPASGPADGAGAPAGELHGAAGPDIGPDLYQLARDADELAARLRALQGWNEALAGSNK